MIHRYHMINVVGAIFFLSYLLSDKMSAGKWSFALAYLVIISMGVYTMNHASKDPVWDMPRQHKCAITIEEGKFYSSKAAPLIISDFKKVASGLGYLKFLEMANAWSSNSIDILYASTDIKNLSGLLNGKDYSDIFVSFSSDELLNRIRSEFGESVKKVDFKGVAAIWKIENPPEKTQSLTAAVGP